ncbi:MAG: hypothetical protein WCF85_15310 [Rhodospirillaceae bacterium]
MSGAAERSLRDVVPAIVVAMSITLFSAISLGFGTFAAYGYLRGLLGGVVAALIVSAAYGLVAVTIRVVWTVRRRQARRVRCAAAAAPALVGTVTSLLRSLAEAGTPQDREIMAAAERLGREISPMELLALAVIGGFIVGRKLAK